MVHRLALVVAKALGKGIRRMRRVDVSGGYGRTDGQKKRRRGGAISPGVDGDRRRGGTLAVLALAGVLFGWMPVGALAVDRTPAEAGASAETSAGFVQLTKRMHEADAAVLASFGKINETVKAEAAAGRLTQRDRMRGAPNPILQQSAEEKDVDKLVFFAHPLHGLESAALEAAWSGFEEAVANRSEVQHSITPSMLKAVMKSAVQSLLQAERPADLDASLQLLHEVQAALPKSGPDNVPTAHQLDAPIRYLQGFREVLGAEVASEPGMMASHLQGLRGNPFGEESTEAELNGPLERARERFNALTMKQIDATLKRLPEVRAREAQDLSNHVEALSEQITDRRLPGVASSAEGQVRASFALAWFWMLEYAERNEWEAARSRYKELAASARDLPPELASLKEEAARRFERLMEEREEEEAGTLSKIDGLLARGEQAQGAAELQAIVADLNDAAQSVSSERQGPVEGARQEIERLEALTEVWRSVEAGNPLGLGLAAQPGWGSVPGLPDDRWEGLRRRIERQAVAAELNRPELLETLPAGPELPDALTRLAQTAAREGRWLEVYDLLSAKASLRGGAAAEELAGVRAFIIGQNFEAAEEYASAVKAYQRAVGSMGAAVSFSAAAERLKTLKQQHPEAFTHSTLPTR